MVYRYKKYIMFRICIHILYESLWFRKQQVVRSHYETYPVPLYNLIGVNYPSINPKSRFLGNCRKSIVVVDSSYFLSLIRHKMIIIRVVEAMRVIDKRGNDIRSAL